MIGSEEVCEILAMSFNLPIKPKISFKGFRYRGKKNPNGWGIAFYPDKSAQVMKEPVEVGKSPLAKFLQNYDGIKTKIFIAHVRRASKGSKSHKNTHPFSRELNGKEYVFVHNGNIENFKNLSTGRFKPIGDTDSEHVFCHLLNWIEEQNISWDKNSFNKLSNKLKELNKYGTFNCVFSDGEFLFCYSDKNSYNRLCFLHRKPSYGKIHLVNEELEVNLEEEKRQEQTGFIIATRRLTNESWEDFKPGELIVFKNGKMIYSNKRNVGERFT